LGDLLASSWILDGATLNVGPGEVVSLEQQWLVQRRCPVLRIDGDTSADRAWRRCSGFQVLTRDSAHRRMGGAISIQLLLIAHAVFTELSDLDLELARALGQLRHVENGVSSVVRRVVARDGLD
jgi:hypothetical protein